MAPPDVKGTIVGGIYPSSSSHRHVFTIGPLTFGVVIGHEGWRYPETVRWAVRPPLATQPTPSKREEGRKGLKAHGPDWENPEP